MAAFIQIIEYETDQPDEVMALGGDQAQQAGSAAPYTRMTVTQDREQPKRYLAIVEFPSADAAKANDADPQTQEFAARMAELCTSGPTYHNLDAVYTGP